MTASTSAHGRTGMRRILGRVASFIAATLIVAAVLPAGTAGAFSDVTVFLHLRGFFGSVSVRANGSTIGTCSVSNCLFTVPVGSAMRLIPDGDITSWGPGPCQSTSGTQPCSFAALSNTVFQPVFLG